MFGVFFLFLVARVRVSICSMQLQGVVMVRWVFLGKVVFSYTKGSTCSKSNSCVSLLGAAKQDLYLDTAFFPALHLLAKVQGRD